MEAVRTLSPEERGWAQLLCEHGQAHLFENWAPGDGDEERKCRFFQQVRQLNESYPGGLVAYISNARELLRAAAQGENPLHGVIQVNVPLGVNLDYGSQEYDRYEAIGFQQLPYLSFVLVAGGLGERLGFNGIKLALPIELASMKTFLETYCDSITALQRRSGIPELKIPLAIMTSDDTHARTEALLEKNHWFSLSRDQVFLMKQEKVPALNSNEAHLCTDKLDPYTLLTKPHGHGDVHRLLHTTGIAQRWFHEGRRWVVFFQDTNGLVFRSMLAVLGVSHELNLDLNSMCIPREAKQVFLCQYPTSAWRSHATTLLFCTCHPPSLPRVSGSRRVDKARVSRWSGDHGEHGVQPGSFSVPPHPNSPPRFSGDWHG
uniref:UTP-monosaccharide-1-phosphate uridylyltransferase n=1 Tax=Rhizochromulina marina TaxID=1034831 RepID=A0A7S2WAN4_9STRA|mmetsp:Transcript_19196/g.55813  ORF Transcript_19196/g.55813 Transcript_19196/m.55813 type:complete len:375 (+) Transcript_19196:35-1159(+)